MRRPSSASRWRFIRSWPTKNPPSSHSAGIFLCHSDFGALLFATARLSDAEAEHRTAMAIEQKLAEDNPGNTDIRVLLANSHRSLGQLLFLAGKLSEAEVEYRTALAINQKLAGDDLNKTYFRFLLASSHGSLGYVLLVAGSTPRRRPSAAGRWQSIRSRPTRTLRITPSVTPWPARSSVSAPWSARSAGRPKPKGGTNRRSRFWNSRSSRIRQMLSTGTSSPARYGGAG